MTSIQLPFKHPTTMLTAGPTGCGKTQFLLKLIEQRAFQPPPQRIVCVYGEWQDAYDKLRLIASRLGSRLEFIHNPDADGMAALYESFDAKTRNLLILDDQMANPNIRRNQGGGLTKLFAQGSHHRNLSIIYIVQNVFNQSPEMRNVSLNSHYLVLFKNARDKTQVRTIGQQMFPTQPKFLVSAFDDATNRPYGYLVLDMHPSSSDDHRVRTDIFGTNTTVYKPDASI